MLHLHEYTREYYLCQEKNKKNAWQVFIFFVICSQRTARGGLEQFFDRERIGGQCKFSDFFELENLCYISPELPEVVFCGFFME